ncbi:transcriptional regulator [Naasia aerilata]|uniref:Transcriptional regulator n=2 Tax=Naasia aerilata TaxID=1162966 RepID=A0ABM8GCZ9_9MICO|nr:transcriptional regulator [Naasia aerilata]
MHTGQKAVLQEVLVHGALSRADLSRRTGFSRTSLTRLSRDLVDFGLVEEGETRMLEGRGRPAEMLSLVDDSAQFAGVKLTGDSLHAVVTNLSSRVLRTVDQPLPDRSVEGVIDQIGEVLGDFRRSFPRLSAVGVCLAGDVSSWDGEEVVLRSRFLGWDGVPVHRLVAEATGLRVAVSNDVQALTAAHHWFGAGVGLSTFAVIGLGAGIGAGLVVDGHLARGGHGRAGKVGHTQLEDAGDDICDLGHRGCASTVVTIPSILRHASADSFEDVLAAVDRGDPDAIAAMQRAGSALGAVIAQLVNLVDPDKVVVTGEGRQVAELASADMQKTLESRLDEGGSAAVEVWPFEFADYARAAAVTALRSLV